jgi:hypothetical protein
MAAVEAVLNKVQIKKLKNTPDTYLHVFWLEGLQDLVQSRHHLHISGIFVGYTGKPFSDQIKSVCSPHQQWGQSRLSLLQP